MNIRPYLPHLLLPFVVLATTSTTCYPQLQDTASPGNTRFTFLPDGILFTPLFANLQEPRVGVRKQVGSSRMKLDIGGTMDILEIDLSCGGRKIRAGIDFFAYALSTNSSGLRLQIDAVDGHLGGHISYLSTGNTSEFSMRLRILHLSSHFADGHYNKTSGTWKEGKAPIPFTKDFGELIGGYELRTGTFSIRLYSGFAHAVLARPAEIRRLSSIHGFEIHSDRFIGQVGGKPSNVYLAGNFTLVGIPRYVGSNNIECGLKLGAWNGSGVRLYGSYFDGLDVFNQYYSVRREEWGLGFAFDLW